MKFGAIRSVLSVVAVAALPAIASANILQFQTPINGAQEVPPNGSTATGFSILFYNDQGTAALGDDLFSVTTWASGLLTFTNAHIHGPRVNPPLNGPVIVSLINPPAVSSFAGGAFFSSVAGTAPANLLSALNTGNAYVNIHTQALPAGEIAGVYRLVPTIPEPSTYAMMGAGLALLGFMAHRRRRHHD